MWIKHVCGCHKSDFSLAFPLHFQQLWLSRWLQRFPRHESSFIHRQNRQLRSAWKADLVFEVLFYVKLVCLLFPSSKYISRQLHWGLDFSSVSSRAPEICKYRGKKRGIHKSFGKIVFINKFKRSICHYNSWSALCSLYEHSYFFPRKCTRRLFCWDDAQLMINFSAADISRDKRDTLWLCVGLEKFPMLRVM